MSQTPSNKPRKQSPKSTTNCAACNVELFNRRCIHENGKPSAGCPTLTKKKMTDYVDAFYDDPNILEFLKQAALVESDGNNNPSGEIKINPTKTRIEEIGDFAQKMGYKKLGLAFCVGLSQEAGIVNDILKHRGFDIVSVICKVGCVSKERIGVKKEEFTLPKIGDLIPGASETMCNPIFQAEIMNAEKTDFNIVLGLCVGHDSVFFKHSNAYTTVLAVKDRVTGHNPLAAIYTASTFYQKLKN